MVLRWKLSRVLLLMWLFGSSSELKPTQPAVTCTAVRQPEGTTYHLSRLDWSPECKRCWETKNGTVLARGLSGDEKMVEEVTEQSIKVKGCLDDVRFLWHCWQSSQERKEAICRVNCSLPLMEEDHTPQENNTMKQGLTKDVHPEKRSIVLGLVFGIFGLVVVIFGSWFIMKLLKERIIIICRQEDVV